MAHDLELHGTPLHESRLDGYHSPAEFEEQGDTRMIRFLSFSYSTAYHDPAGVLVLEPREAKRDEVVSLDQIGLLALESGERHHAFYTTEERKRVEAGGTPETPVAPTEVEISDMGEYELAEFIKGGNSSGKELTVDEVLSLAGDDPDLAHRLLQAENIATDGDPRVGVEKGLNAIIARG